MVDEARQELSADDLALVNDPDEAAGDAGTDGAEGDKASGAGDAQADKGDPKGKTIATGADAEAEAKAKEDKAAEEHKPYWPDDWREKLAEYKSAGDKKLYKKELDILKRYTGPEGIYGSKRDGDTRFSEGGLIKVPGKDAKEEEIKEFQKVLGWTEKPEEMLDRIVLADGAVLGDDDKPVLKEFLAAVYGATSAAEFASKATNWHLARQEQAAADMDDADDEFRRESETAIKEEWGPAFKRRSNAIGSIFATAPGGVDVKNEDGLFARLMGGRMADGKRVGNDPDMLRWLDSIRGEINPAASVVEDGAGTQSVEAELEKIKGLRKTDPQKYWANDTQKREQELYAALEKIQVRQRA
jgi:hypothetical protein